MSEFDNPYAASYTAPRAPKNQVSKKTDVSPGGKSGGRELATRLQRFNAAFIDKVIWLFISVPIVLGAVAIVINGFQDLPSRENGTLILIIIFAISLLLALVITLCIHGYLLSKSGQTVGKYMLGIQIIGNNNKLLPLPELIFKRYVIVHLIALIPFAGYVFVLLDSLAIFRSNRKCIHDEIAKTKVVVVDN